MYIQITLKSIGKKNQSIKPTPYEIPSRPTTVRELILAVTEAEVRTYNNRIDTPQLLAHLTQTKEEIEDQAQAGKVSFQANYNGKKADLTQAQENAIQCFEDGIYRIFQDNRPLGQLEDTITVTEQSVFTFVRLTMLAGRMW